MNFYTMLVAKAYYNWDRENTSFIEFIESLPEIERDAVVLDVLDLSLIHISEPTRPY